MVRFKDWLEDTSTSCIANFPQPLGLPMVRREFPKKKKIKSKQHEQNCHEYPYPEEYRQ
jgi:predicted solute-binding protein